MAGAVLSLASLGWDDAWRDAAAPCLREGTPGRVARVDRGACTVLTTSGPVQASLGAEVLAAMANDASAAPVTGDWCVLRHWPDGPLTIDVVLPRRTCLVRAESSRRSRAQLLAANLDLAGVVVALHPEPNLERVERLVTLALQSRAQPVVVLTKTDLVNDSDLVAADVRAAVGDVDVICCSTATGVGVDDVRALVTAGTTLGLLGASGHGKSSLANALVGAPVLKTRAIREDGKGRHTTVRRELVLLPGGGVLLDMPGMRGVGLPEGAGGLAPAFPDIDTLGRECRFRDCRHESEPGCAVLAAVAAGAVPVRRLDSWHKLDREQVRSTERAHARRRTTDARYGRQVKPARQRWTAPDRLP
jgi:ribosome biogenesis GTPase / thiamine phosphate phosphatase